VEILDLQAARLMRGEVTPSLRAIELLFDLLAPRRGSKLRAIRFHRGESAPPDAQLFPQRSGIAEVASRDAPESRSSAARRS